MARKISARTKEASVKQSHGGTPFRVTARALGVPESDVRRWWHHYNNKRFVILPNPDGSWFIMDTTDRRTVADGFDTASDASAGIFEFL